MVIHPSTPLYSVYKLLTWNRTLTLHLSLLPSLHHPPLPTMNGGMNDGTYRVVLTGMESWRGRLLHQMSRGELAFMWHTEERSRHQHWLRRIQLENRVMRIRAEPAHTLQLLARQRQFCRELELSILRHQWEEAQSMVRQSLAGAYLVEEHQDRGPPCPSSSSSATAATMIKMSENICYCYCYMYGYSNHV